MKKKFKRNVKKNYQRNLTKLNLFQVSKFQFKNKWRTRVNNKWRVEVIGTTTNDSETIYKRNRPKQTGGGGANCARPRGSCGAQPGG